MLITLKTNKTIAIRGKYKEKYTDYACSPLLLGCYHFATNGSGPMNEKAITGVDKYS
jgi:hypothetical protein